MTVPTGYPDFLKYWNKSDATSQVLLQKVLLKGLDKLGEKTGDILSLMSEDKPATTQTTKWLEQWNYPTAVVGQLTGGTTFTVTGPLFGKALKAGSVLNVLRDTQTVGGTAVGGTILMRESDGYQIHVTDTSAVADPASFAVTVEAWSSSIAPVSASNDDAPTVWKIIQEPWADFMDAQDPRALERSYREVGNAMYAETFDISDTEQDTAYEEVSNEQDMQIFELLQKLRRQQNYSALHSLPRSSGGSILWGDQVQDPTMLGLCQWPGQLYATDSNENLYVTVSGDLYKSHLDTLMRNMWLEGCADFGLGDWWIICHPDVAGKITSWDEEFRRTDANRRTVGAFEVDNFKPSRIGKKFPILPLQEMRQNQLIVADLSQAKYKYFRNQKMKRKEIATNGFYKRWLIGFQMQGIILRKTRSSIGEIHGFNVTA